MRKSLFLLPFLGLMATVAPAQTPAPAAVPINPPAEVAADPANRLNLLLSNGGTVVVLLRPDVAPNHVERIRTLVNRGFYNGLTFHRVIPGFMAQGGDPKGDGSGGSELPDLKAEFSPLPHLRGSLAMARSEEEDSANSQFYITFAPRASLNGKYTVLGRVIEGMAAVDSIAQGEPPENPTRIVAASIGATPPVVAASPVPPLESVPAQAAAPEVAPAADPLAPAEAAPSGN